MSLACNIGEAAVNKWWVKLFEPIFWWYMKEPIDPLQDNNPSEFGFGRVPDSIFSDPFLC